MTKIDLNAPAFGQNAQKVSELESEETKVVVEEEIKPEVKEEIEESEEESKVPYSRFKKFHDAAKEAQEQAEYWKAKANAIKEEPVTYNEDLPAQWVKLYGDSEESKKAWSVQQDLNRQLREDTIKEAREVVRSERYEEIERTEHNVGSIDNNLESLTDFVGRTLTEKEESAVLDIVDDFTPKDKYGDYAGPLIPFEKAWEIYEMRTQSSKANRTQSRDQVASLTSSQSQGDSNAKAEQDKNWNPLNWNGYKDRL